MPRRAELECTDVRDRLDPFLDDDLGRREAGRLQAHLDACPGCREELRLARKLRAALREGLPTLTCPPEVTENVLRIARAEAAGREERQRTNDGVLGRLVRAVGRLKPAASEAGSKAGPADSLPGLSWATVAALVALVTLLVGVPFALRDSLWPDGGAEPVLTRNGARDRAGDELPGTEAAAGYSAAEVARAEREARMVLAAVAAVGRDAGRTVQDQVLEDALRRPARQAARGLRALQGVPEPTAERRQP